MLNVLSYHTHTNTNTHPHTHTYRETEYQIFPNTGLGRVITRHDHFYTYKNIAHYAPFLRKQWDKALGYLSRSVKGDVNVSKNLRTERIYIGTCVSRIPVNFSWESPAVCFFPAPKKPCWTPQCSHFTLLMSFYPSILNSGLLFHPSLRDLARQ